MPEINFKIEEKGSIDFKLWDFDKEEAYSLKTDSHGITIRYSDFLGARNALATLVQLLTIEDDGYSVPFCKIEDFPSFKVRSFMLDLARGIGRKEEIKTMSDSFELTNSRKYIVSTITKFLDKSIDKDDKKETFYHYYKQLINLK